jgi:hypothetical protein
MSGSVPIKGLIDPDKEGTLLVRYLPNGYIHRPQRDATQRVERWKLVQQLRPTYISTPEAEIALRPAMEEAFEALARGEEQEALEILGAALEGSKDFAEQEGVPVTA